jgi:diguanylate cyclase (GGDEF)-like protein/PAS domain S-box-containing protein
LISPDAHPRLREFAEAVKHSPSEVFTVNAQRVVTSHNRSSSRAYGYTVANIVGHTAEAVLPNDETRAARLDFVNRVLSGERVPAFEQRRLSADGRVAYVEIYGGPVMDDAGAIVGMFASARDVTGERAERAAREQIERELRQSFEAALMGVLFVDLEGRVTRVNRALCTMLGRPQEELVAITFYELIDPEDRDAARESWRLMTSDQIGFDIRTMRYRHPDGYSIWVELSVSLVTDADGNPLHYVVQVQDITERQEYEERLRYMVDHDPLTGLLNRRGFDHGLRDYLRERDPLNPIGALLVIDLDNFKQHNDTHGHQAGDQMLKKIAAALTAVLPDEHLVGRLGGDEFGVLLAGVDEAESERAAGTLSLEIAAAVERAGVDPFRPVTASIGLAFPNLRDPNPADDLMERADNAMYVAKARGRNRNSVYTAPR